MKIFGLDFTNVPSKRKTITYAQCSMDVDNLVLQSFGHLTSFDEFETFLAQSGPWVMGMDFPFGQPRKLIENIGWPRTWERYVQHVAGISKSQFVEALAKYRAGRPKGDKQHLRRTDELANSRSPMMLYGVPVGKMFFEGAPRLLRSGASIQPCCVRDDSRIIVEAYPALVARRWIGNRGYKSDTKKKQTLEKRSAREEIVRGLRSPEAKNNFGLMFISANLTRKLSSRTVPAINWMVCFALSRLAGPTHNGSGITASLPIAIRWKAGSWIPNFKLFLLTQSGLWYKEVGSAVFVMVQLRF